MRGAAHATVTIDVPFDFHSWPVRLLLPAPSMQSGAPGEAQQEVTAIVHFVGPGYFDTLGTRLLSGTDFGNELAVSERPVCMVSQAFARALGARDAVGRQVLPDAALSGTRRDAAQSRRLRAATAPSVGVVYVRQRLLERLDGEQDISKLRADALPIGL